MRQTKEVASVYQAEKMACCPFRDYLIVVNDCLQHFSGDLTCCLVSAIGVSGKGETRPVADQSDEHRIEAILYWTG